VHQPGGGDFRLSAGAARGGCTGGATHPARRAPLQQAPPGPGAHTHAAGRGTRSANGTFCFYSLDSQGGTRSYNTFKSTHDHSCLHPVPPLRCVGCACGPVRLPRGLAMAAALSAAHSLASSLVALSVFSLLSFSLSRRAFSVAPLQVPASSRSVRASACVPACLPACLSASALPISLSPCLSSSLFLPHPRGVVLRWRTRCDVRVHLHWPVAQHETACIGLLRYDKPAATLTTFIFPGQSSERMCVALRPKQGHHRMQSGAVTPQRDPLAPSRPARPGQETPASA